MKKRILVLDAYTNGEEAAKEFIWKKKWTDTEVEIIFCGTHQLLLKKLVEGPAFAVVPVRNLTVGAITEVTEPLARYRGQGYELKTTGIIDLKVNHCLLAPQHVVQI